MTKDPSCDELEVRMSDVQNEFKSVDNDDNKNP